MFKKLEQVEKRFMELEEKIADPEFIQNQNEWKKAMKERSDLEEVVSKYREYKKATEAIEFSKELLNDKEMKELAQIEIDENTQKVEKLEEEIKFLLLPKDPNDDKNVIIEIRGGTGGEESALFAAEIFRMYARYAERRHWKLEMIDENPTELGGYKEVSFMIQGKGAYSRLKFESGVHRVQRVPETEAKGRVQTSAVTVAVLPEVDDIEVEINPNDIRTDVYRSSGAGGQHVNKTSSAIRLTHIPTGIVVTCQNERSQLQNRETAMKMLKAKLYEKELTETQSKLSAERKTQVGSGDRSEKIRTYNFPESRVTDHRIKLTLYKIDAILDGDIDEIIDALITNDRAEKLKAGSEQ